jgi:predicted branched-subunit amino acid permease
VQPAREFDTVQLMLRPWQDPAWRAEFRVGLRDMLPASPGIFAWGLVTGVAMVKGGLSVPLALLMTLVAYAGSAQLASLPLIAASAPIWIIAVTALATNMRFVIYAAALRPWLAQYSPRRLSALGYISGDFSFVLFMNRVGKEGAFLHRDAWLFNWLVWQVASIVGIVAGAFIPAHWGLEFAGTLALLALAVPSCATRPGAAGALVAGLMALAGQHWPYKLGLLSGVVLGITAAMVVDGLVMAANGERRA